MAAFPYLDFDVLLSRTSQGYLAHAINSPAGQATAEFALPCSSSEREEFLARLAQARREPQRVAAEGAEAARLLGGKLFVALLGGALHGCFRSSLDEAKRQGAGLRLRLHLNDAPDLADLPWEFLYDPALMRFLTLSTDTPLIRYLELPERVLPLAVKPPLRILVMIANPTGFLALNTADEWTRLQAAFADLEKRELVVIERTDEANLNALRERLQRNSYHIFHFIGHGGFDESAQAGALIFQDAADQVRPASGQELGTLLHDCRTLRLAVLTACEGARSGRAAPFAGVAQGLMQQGIPAVVAMQFEISDDASAAFTQGFYAALAAGYPVDAALAEARKAIFAGGNAVEWGTPALYMRAPDGILWNLAGETTMESATQRTQPWWDRLPVQTGPARVGGDIIIAEVGAGARGVAVGKNITQTIYETLGEPTPDDKQTITQQFQKVTASLQQVARQLDATTARMAEFQLKLLQGELTKTEEKEVPSANTITQIGDWLLDSVPAFAEALTGLFATPAVGRVVGKAGDVAVMWVRKRFGRDD